MANNYIKMLDKLESKTKIYLGVILVLLIVLCIYELKFLIPSIILTIIICIYTVWVNNKRKAEISKHIQELTINVDSAAKNTWTILQRKLNKKLM